MNIAVAGATGRVGRHVVSVLEENGHEVVEISRSNDVDVITGENLPEALAGVECIVDVTSGPSPDEKAATEFFAAATRNLQQAGKRAGVTRMVGLSIIGIDQFSAGYMRAKIAHEKAMRSGPIPVRILRAAQFHEFVAQFMEWGLRGEVSYVPKFRTQLVAARNVAEALAELATQRDPMADPRRGASDAIPEIAGPRAENLAEMARLLASRRGDRVRIEEVTDLTDPDHALYEAGALLPGANAKLAGPTFAEWLDTQVPVPSLTARSSSLY